MSTQKGRAQGKRKNAVHLFAVAQCGLKEGAHYSPCFQGYENVFCRIFTIQRLLTGNFYVNK